MKFHKLLSTFLACSISLSLYGATWTIQITSERNVEYLNVDSDGFSTPLQSYGLPETPLIATWPVGNVTGLLANGASLTFYGSYENIEEPTSSPGADYLNGATISLDNEQWVSVGNEPNFAFTEFGSNEFIYTSYTPPGTAMDITAKWPEGPVYVYGSDGINQYTIGEITASFEGVNFRSGYTDTNSETIVATSPEFGFAVQFNDELVDLFAYEPEDVWVVGAQYALDPSLGNAYKAVTVGTYFQPLAKKKGVKAAAAPIGPIVVDIYDPTTGERTASIRFPDGYTNLPGLDPALSVAAGGERAFVTVPSKNVVAVVDLNEAKILNYIQLDFTPFGVAAAPDPAPTASFEDEVDCLTVWFDASSSSSPSGEISAYQWDFGDGVQELTTEPLTQHVYPALGSYVVTLTVTNTQGTSTVQTYNGHQVVNNGGSSATTTREIVISPEVVVAQFKVIHKGCGQLVFDASGSSTTCGEILSYRWDFGNGQCKTCYTPKVCYTYPEPGCYTVTLIVKTANSSGETSKEVKADGAVNPPKHLEGKQVYRYGNLVNELTWNAPCKCHQPEEYRIYRDRDLQCYVATVKACGELAYCDQVEVPGIPYTYYIVSVDCACNRSEPACVTVDPI